MPKKNGVFKITDEHCRAALKDALDELNKYIGGEEKLEIEGQQVSLNLGSEYQLGGAHFLNFSKYQNEANPGEQLWNNHIAIILNEYLRGRKGEDRQKLILALKSKYKNILKDDK